MSWRVIGIDSTRQPTRFWDDTDPHMDNVDNFEELLSSVDRASIRNRSNHLDVRYVVINEAELFLWNLTE